MTRSPEDEEHARKVRLACEHVWTTYPLMRANGLVPWVDGKDHEYGGYMLPLETQDAPPQPAQEPSTAEACSSIPAFLRRLAEDD